MISKGLVLLVAYSYTERNHARMQKAITDTVFLGIAISVVGISLYELFVMDHLFQMNGPVWAQLLPDIVVAAMSFIIL